MNAEPNIPSAGRRRDESGNALVASLLILMVLTAAGVAYVAVTKSEKQISGNAVVATEAFYNAEAGISEGLYRMSFKKDSLHYVGPAVETAGWGRYIVRASGASALDPDGASLEKDGMDNDGDGSIDESGERYPETLSKQDTGTGGLRYPYVRVEYKTQGGQLVRFGDADQNALTPPRENLTYGAPMLRITASGRRGAATKVLEAEAVRFPLMNVESALWTGTPLSLNGNAFWIDGHDHTMTSPYDTIPGGKAVKGILTKGPKTDVTMTTNQEDNVTGEGGEGSVEQSTFDYDFDAMWNTLSVVAQYTSSGDVTWSSSTPAYGTVAEPAITVHKGNLGIKGTWTGAGILMVDGDLSMQGGSQFKGIVICTGNLDLAGGGPADLAHVVGGVIAKGVTSTSNSTGGAARVFYSSEAINNALTLNRYSLAWWRER